MPYVNIQITEGATREQRKALVEDVTDALVRILGKKPEHTHVVIQQIPHFIGIGQRRPQFERLLVPRMRQLPQENGSARRVRAT